MLAKDRTAVLPRRRMIRCFATLVIQDQTLPKRISENNTDDLCIFIMREKGYAIPHSPHCAEEPACMK
jgi:hypothetical protein